jgi:ATP-binding cassette subfamily B protein
VRGEITVGDFVIVAAVIPSFAGIIWTIGEIAIKTVRQYGEMKNSLQALDSKVEHIRSGDRDIQVESGAIAFENISFAYPNSTGGVLENFNLIIQPGQKVGLVGRSGAGKSTVVKLLLRSYNPTHGKIFVDGQDVTKNTLRSLRNSISFVPQDTALFNRTLFENILYARPDAHAEEVIGASKKAHAHEFISSYPHKYDTLVGERGVKLSGGQRQRIALARAILKNSSILVLDEATSALDGESEEIIQLALQELFQDRTVLAIAHRLSTLRAMDRIIVLENGKIVEDGNPADLLERESSIFKEMWEHQKKGFI